MRHFKTLALRSTATFALLGALAIPAHAQVDITDNSSDQIRTSTAGPNGTPSDVSVGIEDTSTANDPTITAETDAPALVLDSDNALSLVGVVSSNNVENSTGVELQGGDNRSYTQSGNIALLEDFDQDNTDSDPFTDTPFAEGSGRTGILISGASPFRGNIELTDSSVLSVEGNDSYGINLSNTPMMTEGLTGNLTTSGQINVVGDRSVGVNLGSGVTGDVTNEGDINVRGVGAEGYVVEADIQGGFVNNGSITASGYRANQRISFLGDSRDDGREDLSAEDLGQGGSAVRIAGDVTEGIFFSQRLVPSLDDDGNQNTNTDGEPLFILEDTSAVTQFGSAPAVLIGGDGAPIAVGIVAEITDPADADFDEDLQYGFINQGSIASNGLFDDVDATALSVTNVTFDGGISNTGTLSVTSFRAATETTLGSGDGSARVLVLGDQAIAERINNAGIILATANEAADEVFFDRSNIIAPRPLLAVGVDVGDGASVTDLINSGNISALLIGREGQAVAVRDASGTIRTLSNTGSILALGQNSDSAGLAETEFDLIAIDLSAATLGSSITQSQNADSDNAPLIQGDILFGSGDDTLTVAAGTINGDIDFGGGNDTLALSGESTLSGAVRNTDNLTLSITDGATLALGSADPIQVAEATIDSTSTFRPVINGATGQASTLSSTGDITFEAGAGVNPILNSIINTETGTETLTFTLASAGNLTIGDLSTLGAGDSPFLFDTSLQLADANTLIVTLDLRDPTASLENGGLGLDQAQAAAFGQVVDGTFQPGPVIQALASASELGNAFANITESGDFYAAYNQILPEFSGAANQFVLANVDSAVGAVGSHLDTTRRSQDKTGGAWLQEFFYFADRELAGLSEQYRGEGFGFAGGIDTAFGPFHAVGVSAGFASTEVEDVVGIDEPLDVRTYQLGTYAGYETGGFNFDLYGGVGFSDFEQNRRIAVGNFAGSANGEWSGVHANAAARAGYMIPLSETFWARPSLSVDYLYLNEYGRTEDGTDGFRLRVDGRRTETAAATAMLDLGAKFQGKRTWIRPSIRAGYRSEFISDPVLTQFRFQGLEGADGQIFDSELASLRSFAFPDDGIILGFTLAAGSQYSSIGFDFDSDIRDGFVRHTGRIVIRLLF